MRKSFEHQMSIDITPIQNVIIPEKSRDELPPVLRALQYIYKTPEINALIYKILEDKVLRNKKRTGRNGMSLWEILVIAVVKHCVDANYDRLERMVNYDKLVRRILGVETLSGEGKTYGMQTIKDNVSLLDEATIDQINELIVGAAYSLKKKGEDPLYLNLKADTYVVETNVHFPTDLNLLWDSLRKSTDLLNFVTKAYEIPGWNKGHYWKRLAKSLYRQASNVCFTPGTKEVRKKEQIIESYLHCAMQIEEKTKKIIELAVTTASGMSAVEKIIYLECSEIYRNYIRLFVSQISRRVLKGEVIPQEEKVFSIFEPYTEWISKGKTGCPVELGKKCLIVTDQFGFIVYKRILDHEADSSIVIEIAEKFKNGFIGNIVVSMSFDKGGYSAYNKTECKKRIGLVVIPKRGKLSEQEKQEESNPLWKKLKRKHSAIESNINQLEHNSLDRCRDKGLHGLKRATALSSLSYNLHHLGKLLKGAKAKKVEKLRNAA